MDDNKIKLTAVLDKDFKWKIVDQDGRELHIHDRSTNSRYIDSMPAKLDLEIAEPWSHQKPHMELTIEIPIKLADDGT